MFSQSQLAAVECRRQDLLARAAREYMIQEALAGVGAPGPAPLILSFRWVATRVAAWSKTTPALFAHRLRARPA